MPTPGSASPAPAPASPARGVLGRPMPDEWAAPSSPAAAFALDAHTPASLAALGRAWVEQAGTPTHSGNRAVKEGAYYVKLDTLGRVTIHVYWTHGTVTVLDCDGRDGPRLLAPFLTWGRGRGRARTFDTAEWIPAFVARANAALAAARGEVSA